MKTEEAADRLGIATSTLRLWTLEEYAQYLSSTAKGGTGRRRNITDHDLRVLYQIALMKRENTPSEEIHATLKSLQAQQWRGLPDVPPAPPGVEPVSMIPREAAEANIDQQRRALMREIAVLQEEVEALESELQDARSENSTLRSELSATREQLGEARGRLALLSDADADRQRLQGELARAREELGEARGELKGRQPTRFWLIVVAGVLLSGVGLALLLVLLLR